MSERALRVNTRPPQMPAEGTIQLTSYDNGVRWIVKMRLSYKLEAARQSEWAVRGDDAGEMPDTEYAFVGDTEEAAFERAVSWLRERYDVSE